MTGGELTVVVFASFAGMFVKSVTGMGYPLFAIPIVSLFVGVEDAVVVIAAPNAAANAILCYRARHGRAHTRDLARLGGFGIAGALTGTSLLVSLPEDPILVALAVTIVGFVIQSLRSPELRIPASTSRRWAPAVGTTAGVMQGAVGVSGPVLAAWLHGYRLDREAFVFSVTLLFFLAGTSQLGLLVARGEYDRSRTVAALLALGPTLAMIPVGARVRGRLAGRSFERALLALLAVSALALVVRVAT